MPVRAGTRRIEAARASAALPALLLSGALGAAGAGAAPVDVTAKVKARPDLVAVLEEACERVCQGNRREARLLRVTAEPVGGGRFRVEGEAALRNRHVQPVPAGLGGLVGESLTLFDHTVRVRARGTLERGSCLLVVESVELDRDPIGLSRLFAGEVGRRHRVERCGELLPAEPTPPPAGRRPRP